MNTYPKGSIVRVPFEFRLLSTNALVDPTAVFFQWKIGHGGTVTTYSYGDGFLLKTSTGLYYVAINASEVGIYYTNAYSTGTGQASSERSFEVVSQFP